MSASDMTRPAPPRQDETGPDADGSRNEARRDADSQADDTDPDDPMTTGTVADDDVEDEEDRMRAAVDAAGPGGETTGNARSNVERYEPASGLSGAALSDDPDAIAQGGIRAAIGDDEPVNGEDLLADINVDEQNIDVEQQIVEIDAAMPVDVQMRRDQID